MPTVEESSGRRRKGRKKLGDQTSVQSKRELKLLLCHLFPPLSSFGLVHKPKTKLLIEVASRMKSLEGFEIDLSIIFLLAEGDGFLHQSTAETPIPNLR